jgi:hypothetical protein
MNDVGAAIGGILFLALLLTASLFWIWALIDVLRTKDDSQFRRGSRLVWAVVIALTHLPGALIYWFVGRPGREARAA